MLTFQKALFIYFKNCIIIITWLCWVFAVACGFFFAVLHGLLSSCGTWAPEHAGSGVVARGLSCPAACGILVSRPGIEPTSPALEGELLTTGPPGKSP